MAWRHLQAAAWQSEYNTYGGEMWNAWLNQSDSAHSLTLLQCSAGDTSASVLANHLMWFTMPSATQNSVLGIGIYHGQDLEIGCPNLSFPKSLGVLFFQGRP